MYSDVELRRGLSFWIRVIDTPVAVEITANVSPALTIQNLPAGRRPVVGVRVVPLTACSDDEFPRTVEGLPESPFSKPARTRTTAIVAASRNAAGAA
jgi:hypothetical protein